MFCDFAQIDIDIERLRSHPLPFKCVIEPRSAEAEALIRASHFETTL